MSIHLEAKILFVCLGQVLVPFVTEQEKIQHEDHAKLA
jgi:hypothetical protein